MSRRQQFQRWIDRYSPDSKYGGFDAVVSHFALDALRVAPEEADRFVAGARKSLWTELKKKIELDRKRGLTQLVSILSEESKTLSFEPASARREHLPCRKATRAKSRSLVLKKIDELTDREYEALACYALRAIGARDVLLTPPGNEGGIDFYASIPFVRNSHIFTGGSRCIRIVGQSKMFGKPVGVSHVKEFLSTLNDVRHLNPDIATQIPPWFRAANGPIIGLMFGHHGFQSGGVAKSQQHGVVLGDSLDIAELLALSRFEEDHAPEDRAAQLKSGAQAELQLFDA